VPAKNNNSKITFLHKKGGKPEKLNLLLLQYVYRRFYTVVPLLRDHPDKRPPVMFKTTLRHHFSETEGGLSRGDYCVSGREVYWSIHKRAEMLTSH